MNKNLLLLLCILVAGIGYSQKFKLSGIVVDHKGKPIQGVYINNENSRKSVVSKVDGTFAILLDSNRYLLRLSHLSFKDKVVSGNYNKSKNIRISMELEVNDIEEVVVTHKMFDKLDGHSGKHIYDFDLKNNLIFLLSNQNSKDYLEVWSDDLRNKLKVSLDFEPVALEKDCFGNIHILTKEKSRQILLKDYNIGIDKSKSIKDYEIFIRPCVASTDSLVVFSYFENKVKKQLYYAMSRDSLSFHLFHTVQDSVRAKADKELYEWIAISDSLGSEICLSENKCLAGLGRLLFQKETLVRNHIYKTDNNPLFYNDSVFQIIDQVNGRGLLFCKSKLQVLDSQPFDFHKMKGYKNKILRDEVSETVFAVFQLKDMVQLAELTSDFTLKRYIPIEYHSFPEELKVHRGYAYYLSRKNREFSPFVELVRYEIPKNQLKN